MKLKIIYNPPGQDSQSWVIDPEDMDNLESEDIEVAGGAVFDSYGEWMNMMARGNMRAIRALLWVLMKRTQPDLDFNEVRFRTSEVSSEILEDDEPGKGEADDTSTDLQQPTTD